MKYRSLENTGSPVSALSLRIMNSANESGRCSELIRVTGQELANSRVVPLKIYRIYGSKT